MSCMPWCEIELDMLIFCDMCLLAWLNSLPKGAKSCLQAQKWSTLGQCEGLKEEQRPRHLPFNLISFMSFHFISYT